MNFTISAYQPPDRMTFEMASQLTLDLRGFSVSIAFDGYTGRMTVSSDERMVYEALRILKEAKVMLTDVSCPDAPRTFAEFFSKAPDCDDAVVYVMMCREGRIW